MNDALLNLSNLELRELCSALRSGRFTVSSSPIALERIMPKASALNVARHLEELHARGYSVAVIADTLELLLRDRARRAIPDDLMQLVVTGPDAANAVRDTAVVVRDVFTNAAENVLIAGYAVYQGQQVFQALADRMDREPTLKVRMFLDIGREPGDAANDSIVVGRYLERFRTREWPQGKRVPEIFYFPASLQTSSEKRSVLHAKCIVADQKTVFVSSANFTEAAHNRNIELGLLINSPALAERITTHFDSMLAQGFLRRAGGL